MEAKAQTMRPRFPIQIVNGLNIPTHLKTEKIKAVMSMKPRDDDIFVVTYPKCGTHWTQYIVWAILKREEPLPEPGKLRELGLSIQFTGTEVAEQMPSPRNLRVHLPFSHTPYNPKARYIYVTRNPRDCAVSYFHFLKSGIAGSEYANATFDDFFDQFVSNDSPYGNFFDHVNSWIKHENDDNVLHLRYEEMLADPHDAVLKIGKFISSDKLNYFEELTRNKNEWLNQVVEKTSFNNLKHMPLLFKCPKAEQAKSNSNSTHETNETEMITREVALFRKGVKGDWKNTFTEDQIKILDEMQKEKGLENFWKY